MTRLKCSCLVSTVINPRLLICALTDAVSTALPNKYVAIVSILVEENRDNTVDYVKHFLLWAHSHSQVYEPTHRYRMIFHFYEPT